MTAVLFIFGYWTYYKLFICTLEKILQSKKIKLYKLYHRAITLKKL